MRCCGPCIRTNYSFVCTSCGSERMSFGIEDPPGYEQRHSSMRSTTYSRRYRFQNLLLKTINYHSGPNLDDPIWKILEQHFGNRLVHGLVPISSYNIKWYYLCHEIMEQLRSNFKRQKKRNWKEQNKRCYIKIKLFSVHLCCCSNVIS